MQKVFKTFLIILSSFGFLANAEESFITTLEYGKMLYTNPRGIGCVECHGRFGEGQQIANYIHKRKGKTLQGPRINNLSFREFENALQKTKKVMPKYYLTSNEIEAIYKYLESIEKPQEH
ncbi:c-type cytochrome [Helicobacter sp. UBA3407]|uniref:c-type cytochrome n=1 Tax=Helicobacter TaxID=209 RepID=UPI0026209784|nr:c-type cytochrome [Helicobacter sp. UBA3407]